MTVAFIGSAGIPNRYGGFESFLEHCAPSIVERGVPVVVTCDARLYSDRTPDFKDLQRALDTPTPTGGDRRLARSLYTASTIADAYLKVIRQR